MTYCRDCSQDIEVCYGQCPGQLKKAAMRKKEPAYGVSRPEPARKPKDADILQQILASLESMDRRISAVERTAHKQVTMDDIRRTIDSGTRPKRFC